MTKTIYVCDCCGMEVDICHLHKCYKEIQDWTGYKNIPETWELCENCIDRLEEAMRMEAEKIAKEQDEPPNDMYAGGHGAIEVGGLT